MRILLLFSNLMAVPHSKIGAKELFPIHTWRPVHGWYEMNADLLGII
jgi:hypothetical protein